VLKTPDQLLITFPSKKLQNPFQGRVYAFRENAKKVVPFFHPSASPETGTECGQFPAVEMWKTFFNICGLPQTTFERQPFAEPENGRLFSRLLIVR